MVQGVGQSGFYPINFLAIPQAGRRIYIILPLQAGKAETCWGQFLTHKKPAFCSLFTLSLFRFLNQSLLSSPLPNTQSTLKERGLSTSQICAHLLSAENLSRTEWEVPLPLRMKLILLKLAHKIICDFGHISSVCYITSLCLRFLSSSVSGIIEVST